MAARSRTEAPVAPSALPVSSSSSRRLDVQGLRAIAVLMVIAFHAKLPLPGGFVGVDVFFVISGFVITSMLLREHARSGRIDLKRFYIRRFKRLTPALAVMVVITLVASTLLSSPLGPQQNTALTGLGAIALIANLVIAQTSGGYFDAPAATNALLHTWSLSVEEQFYLVFPVLLIVSLRFARRRPWAPAGVVAVVGLVSFVAAVAGSRGVSVSNSMLLAALNLILGFYSPVTRAWEFAAGCLLALGGRAVWGRPSRALSGLLGVIGVIGLGTSAFAIDDRTPFPGLWTLLPVLGTSLVILAGSSRNLVTRLLGSRTLVWVGDLSYSWYLWHWPFIVFAAEIWPTRPGVLVAAGVVAIAPAYASYRWVEEPLRRMPTEGLRPVRWVAALTVPVVAVSLGLLVATHLGFGSPTIRNLQDAALIQHAGERAGCDRIEPLSTRTALKCTWNSPAPGANVYLVGDSHADHYSEAVIGAAEMLNRPVVISTLSNCPFLTGFFARLEADWSVNSRCRAHTRDSLAYLTSQPSGTVIISNTDQMWISVKTALGVDENTARQARSEQREVLEVLLTETVRTLQSAQHDVVLVQDIPMRPGKYAFQPATCSVRDLLRGPHTCGADMPLAVVEPQQQPVRDVLAAVARATGARIIDPVPHMCPDGTCQIVSDGLVRMRDPGHISNAQSEALSETFTRAIG